MREEQFEVMHQEARGQTQEKQPGVEYAMKPEPIYDDPDYVGSGKTDREGRADHGRGQWNRSCRRCRLCERRGKRRDCVLK